MKFVEFFQKFAPWCSGYHYCTTSWWGSRWWGYLTMVPDGNKAKRLSSVNHTAKTIHHHHHTWPLPHCRKIYKKQLLQYVLKAWDVPSQKSLHKFKEHLFLSTTFKVYHMRREHGDGYSKISGVEGASFNL